ncbi:MAG: hypothetical protein GF398_11490 [Chitinivibrionales bacterium]|nr:hypothetical protein [Chitinivibrionales bacterium]
MHSLTMLAPQIQGSNATQYIKMYWGNSAALSESDPAAVFQAGNNFKGVWHLSEDGSAQRSDASTNSNDCSVTGTVSGNEPGISGKSNYFDGSASYLSIPDIGSSGAATISVWFRYEGATGKKSLISHEPWADKYCHFKVEDNQFIASSHPWANNIWASNLSPDIWYFGAYTYNGNGHGNWKLSLNGDLRHTGDFGHDEIVLPRFIGHEYTSRYFKGYMDEVRISNVARSEDWLKLCFESQKLNADMLSFGETVSQSNADEYHVGEGKPYATIADAINALPRNLAGKGEQLIVLHRNGGSAPWIYTDRINLQSDYDYCDEDNPSPCGFNNASQNDYIKITVAEAHRHCGNAGTGVVLSLDGASGSPIISNIAYTQIEWLEIVDMQGEASGVELQSNAHHSLVQNCLIHDGESCAADACEIQGVSTTADYVKIRNCIIYNLESKGVISRGAQNVEVDNVTVYNIDDKGFYTCCQGEMSIHNSISVGCTSDDFHGAIGSNSSHNICSDGTISQNDVTSVRFVDASDLFVSINPGSENLHLKPNNIAVNKGINLNDKFVADIDGGSRINVDFWDIGADEFGVGPALTGDMISQTIYVDDFAVIEREMNGAVFEYQNLDGEGKVYDLPTGGVKANYYIKDHLGSTREVIDEEGILIASTRYDAYGAHEQLLDAIGQERDAREKFTTKELDTEGEDLQNGVDGIQLYYFGARFYDPVIGDFRSPDIMEQFFNSYQYTSRNPITHFDVGGLFDPFMHALSGNARIDRGKGDPLGTKYRLRHHIAHKPSYNITDPDEGGILMLQLMRAGSVNELGEETGWSEIAEGGSYYSKEKLSKSEWRDIQRHAAMDYLNEGANRRDLNTYEQGGGWPSWWNNQLMSPAEYQDYQIAFVILNPARIFSYLRTHFQLEWWLALLELSPEYAIFPEYFDAGFRFSETDSYLRRNNSNLGAGMYFRAVYDESGPSTIVNDEIKKRYKKGDNAIGPCNALGQCF